MMPVIQYAYYQYKYKMSKIFRSNQVDAEKLVFSDIVTNKHGGKACSVKYEGGDLLIQTPRMRLPFGLSKYEALDSEGNVSRVSYSIDMSFTGYEEDDNGEPRNKRVHEMFKLMETLEKKLRKTACENSVEWLSLDEANESVAKALSRDIIRYSRDKLTKKISHKFAPTFKAKVGFWEGRFTVNAFDEERNLIEDLSDQVPGGTEAVAIIRLNNVNFAGGKCGYSWSVKQMKLYRPVKIPKYAFVDDDEDDEPVRVEINKETEPKVVVNTMVSDTDSDEEVDELDEDSESEPEPIPVPAKKKRVRKKKP